MAYEIAIEKAWDDLERVVRRGKSRIKFLDEEYEIDSSRRKIFSPASNVEAKDFYKVLFLHYVINEGKVGGIEKDAWISFREMEGGDTYFPAFRDRAIEPILKKYGHNASGIYKSIKSFPAEKMDGGDAAVCIKAFPKVKVGIIIWKEDEEFEADCNMLFNRSIKKIFPTEDAAVLGGIVAMLI